MNISESNFRKIILLSVGLVFLSILLDVVVSVFVDYGHIESELSLGIIEKIPLWGLLAVTVLPFCSCYCKHGAIVSVRINRADFVYRFFYCRHFSCDVWW